MSRVRIMVAALVVWSGLTSALAADTLTLGNVKQVMTISVSEHNRIECSLTAQWPVDGSGALQQSLQSWVNGLQRKLWSEEDGGGGFSWLSPLESQYAAVALGEALAAKQQDAERRFNLTLDFSLQRLYETRSAISFYVKSPRYGVEGIAADVRAYVTFNKQDGSILTWEKLILPKQQKKFTIVLVSKLMGYFGTYQFNNMMVLTTVPPEATEQTFPLPQNGPVLTAEGIRVDYEPGEIADAQLGRPSCIIPYSSVRSYLTAEGKRWLK
ncbi:MAG: hypothetical protein IJ244_06170 [Bacteroidaceae bacterium]|nr:hypothetical protein [Bacteroidaceae bacterium]